ncbi:MAG: type III-A CRISPR-associated RAMP protein Csm3 [Nitrospirae bacterium]|uniref:type III-A CRISPR-associated RAMP protein Csm3 n=1 Tax=Candidatus Magnetobacterium casense TaxID=1455061 RepID=UPI00058FFAAC|nr:type III-A CRISPR-associated RAMP protein Csm3 [Candidatus Magnetobacterium casensis]MBF0337418.1 type III-A CRISPR-associated RAMP protein Csm3 [Nitrospirota bacterium]
MELRLKEIKKLEGKITLKSGLHIGSGNTEMHIGGTDSPVIKHPHTRQPYIPGSSLKGKVRALLEMESGLMVYTGGDVVSGKTLDMVKNDKDLKAKCTGLLKVFGVSADAASEEIGPTRASFADCYLDSEWLKKAQDNRWPLTEEKSENVINRIKGTAENPRFIERVPEGTVFNFLITFKVLAEDDEVLFESVLKGLKLLEMDALGGSGSRGYGRIKISFNDEGINSMFEGLKPFKQGGGS